MDAEARKAITVSAYDDLKIGRRNCERPYDAVELLRGIADKIESEDMRTSFIVKDIVINTYEGYATAYILMQDEGIDK